MDRHKPQMRDRRLPYRVYDLVATGTFGVIDPRKKRIHLMLKPFGGGRFKVNLFAADRPRDHLHRAF